VISSTLPYYNSVGNGDESPLSSRSKRTRFVAGRHGRAHESSRFLQNWTVFALLHDGMANVATGQSTREYKHPHAELHSTTLSQTQSPAGLWFTQLRTEHRSKANIRAEATTLRLHELPKPVQQQNGWRLSQKLLTIRLRLTNKKILTSNNNNMKFSSLILLGLMSFTDARLFETLRNKALEPLGISVQPAHSNLKAKSGKGKTSTSGSGTSTTFQSNAGNLGTWTVTGPGGTTTFHTDGNGSGVVLPSGGATGAIGSECVGNNDCQTSFCFFAGTPNYPGNPSPGTGTCQCNTENNKGCAANEHCDFLPNLLGGAPRCFVEQSGGIGIPGTGNGGTFQGTVSQDPGHHGSWGDCGEEYWDGRGRPCIGVWICKNGNENTCQAPFRTDLGNGGL